MPGVPGQTRADRTRLSASSALNRSKVALSDPLGPYRGAVDDAITDAELDEIEARALGATAGPWEAFVEGRDHLGGDDFIRTGGVEDDTAPDMYVSLAFPDRPGGVPAPPPDLDFIAAARQDVPRLVKEIRRLRELDRS